MQPSGLSRAMWAIEFVAELERLGANIDPALLADPTQDSVAAHGSPALRNAGLFHPDAIRPFACGHLGREISEADYAALNRWPAKSRPTIPPW